MHRAYLQKPKSSLYTSKNRVKNIKIRNRLLGNVKWLSHTQVHGCPLPLSQMQRGGRQAGVTCKHLHVDPRSTDSISVADSPISRPHCPRRAIQASKRICGSVGYRQIKSSKLGEAPEPKVNLAPSLANDKNMTSRSAGVWSPGGQWWKKLL